jgi:hypothetical protein
MKRATLGDLFAIFPDLPYLARPPLEARVQSVRDRAEVMRRNVVRDLGQRRANVENVRMKVDRWAAPYRRVLRRRRVRRLQAMRTT